MFGTSTTPASRSSILGRPHDRDARRAPARRSGTRQAQRDLPAVGTAPGRMLREQHPDVHRPCELTENPAFDVTPAGGFEPTSAPTGSCASSGSRPARPSTPWPMAHGHARLAGADEARVRDARRRHRALPAPDRGSSAARRRAPPATRVVHIPVKLNARSGDLILAENPEFPESIEEIAIQNGSHRVRKWLAERETAGSTAGSRTLRPFVRSRATSPTVRPQDGQPATAARRPSRRSDREEQMKFCPAVDAGRRPVDLARLAWTVVLCNSVSTDTKRSSEPSWAHVSLWPAWCRRRSPA